MRHIHIFDNLYLVASVIVGLFLTFIVLLTDLGRYLFDFVVLPSMDWGILALLAVMEIVLLEAVKYAFIVRHKKK